MSNRDRLSSLSREDLLDLIDMYAKNWLALDGVWFQAVERDEGMDVAMKYDAAAWERYTGIEARRIKAFLGLAEHPGLEGLEQALRLRLYAGLNEDTFEWRDGSLIYSMIRCRVQTARERRGMPYHPCRPVGLVEYAGFAKEIDERITCRCLSCYPDVQETDCCCRWQFTLEDGEERPAAPERE